MLSKFKCPHCGNDDPQKTSNADGVITCQVCGWTFDMYGAHPPEMEEFRKRKDWQQRNALICYAPNMLAFLQDMRNYSGNSSQALSFLRGWVDGFMRKINKDMDGLNRAFAQIPEAPKEQRQEAPALIESKKEGTK